ncbi:MAG TPA: DUF4255 domain-containing protein [Rudaea sp.]|jgi:hypothetical protein|uniref:DUF4255 domain-containing protein n=1 Tax=Rudaea sp. TaxID=2136325 RepID=UPI002F94D839
MSESTAIAATTTTLQHLLSGGIPSRDQSLPGLVVTTMPPDLARKGHNSAQLNIFLYQTQVNAAWRNLDIPNQVRPGETATPPLALNLHYMLTAYGDENDDETVSHRVLGGAMSVLHDHPLLGRAEISSALAGSGLENQFERLRITPIVLLMDEMSKLWTALQSNYRLSAGYEVTVLLIDSTLPVKASLPVLKRSADDRGPVAVAGRAPSLDGIRYPRSQQAARLGDDIALTGSYLAVANTTVEFSSLRLPKPILLTPTVGDRTGEIKLHIPSLADDPNAMTNWVPGLYTVAVIVQQTSGPPLISNEIAFALAPTITRTPTTAAAGTINPAITCTPRIAAGQRVLLLFGDGQTTPDSVDQPPPAANAPSLAKFTLNSVAKNADGTAKTYTVRLRVDGIDSIPVILTGTPPLPAFDPAQQITIT